MGQHRRGSIAILAVAAVCLIASGVGAYGAWAVLDEEAFADRAVSTLGSDEVRDDIGARISGRLAGSHPELWPGEPVLHDAIAGAVTATPEFVAAFREGSVRLHRGLFLGGDASLLVPGSGAMLRAELRGRLPGLEVPRMEDVPLFTIGSSPAERTLQRLAPAARGVAIPLAIGLALLGFALLALAVGRERDHRRAVWGAGLAIAGVGGLTAVGVTAAQDFVLDHFDTGFGDAVVTSVWDAYLYDLRLWALGACAVGLVVAAAAGGPRPSVAAMLAAPASLRGRVLRATGLLVAAGLAVQLPELVLHAGLVVLAAGLVYVAAGDLMPRRPRSRPAPRPAVAASPPHSSTARPRSSSRPRRTW